MIDEAQFIDFMSCVKHSVDTAGIYPFPVLGEYASGLRFLGAPFSKKPDEVLEFIEHQIQDQPISKIVFVFSDDPIRGRGLFAAISKGQRLAIGLVRYDANESDTLREIAFYDDLSAVHFDAGLRVILARLDEMANRINDQQWSQVLL